MVGIGQVHLLCVYAPAASARERQSFFESLPWDELGPLAIVAGDWNCTLAPGEHVATPCDSAPRVNPNRHLRPDADALRSYVANRGLVDPAEYWSWAPGAQRFSRAAMCGTNVFVQSRLDRFFVSEPLVSRLCGHSIDETPFRGSDHHSIRLRLKPGRAKRGEGLWRMNPNTATLKGIPSIVAQALSVASDDSPPDRYTAHVARLQKLLEQAELEAANRNRARVEAARARLQEAQAQLAAGHRGRQAVAEWQVARDALRAVEGLRAASRLGRRRRRHFRHGDRPTAEFFASVNRRSGGDNTIAALNGAASSDSADLAEAARRYYQTLFSGRHADPDAVRKCCEAIQRKVPADKRAALGAPLTLEELTSAVKKIPSSSAPGGDGLRAGLYRRHPKLLEPVLDTWNHCMENKTPLPRALSTGIITLLHKKGDVRELDNYRPITLLTVAIKALAGALAARVNAVLRDVVGPNQTGFIKRRDIRSNIYEVIFAHQAARRDGVSGAIVFLDMKKAYDKLSHDFILKVLETMEFPPYFIDAVRLLITNGVSLIMVNGVLSDVVALGSGVPQGSPLSPALFVIATEPFRAALEQAPIPGLMVAGLDLRCNMYADDGNYFIGSQASFHQFQQLLRIWCSAATMEVNVAKSAAITFGPHPPDVRPYRVLAEGEFERVLGARVGLGEDDNPVWPQVERKLRAKIGRFSRFRHLSLFGRVLLANACVLSHIWYAASFLSVDEMDLHGVFKASNHFVWDPTPGFRKAMSFSQSCRPAAHGGVGLLDPELEVKAIHAHRLVSALMCDEEGAWRRLLWDAIARLAPLHRGQLLKRKWTRRDLGDSLAADILLAFTALDVDELPALAPQRVDWDPARRRWRTTPHRCLPANRWRNLSSVEATSRWRS